MEVLPKKNGGNDVRSVQPKMWLKLLLLCMEYILCSVPDIRILKTVTLTGFNKHILETMGHYVINKCDSRYTTYDFTNSRVRDIQHASEIVRGKVSLAVSYSV